MLNHDSAEEYAARYAGRLFGMYASVVKDIDDPDKLGRVKVYCPKLYGEDLSPWAFPCFPSAIGIDTGSVDIPPMNSYVWITFEEGDPASPIYMGGFALPTSKGRVRDGSSVEDLDPVQRNDNPLPLHAQGLPDGTDYDGITRGTDELPETPFRGEYGKVQVKRTESGHVLEFDNTDGAERIFLLHGPSGAYYEMQPDGSIIEVAAGFKTTSTRGEHKTILGPSSERVLGKTERIYGGEYSVSYLGRYSASVEGTSLTFDGDGLVASIVGQFRASASSYSLSSFGPFDISSGDAFSASGSSVNLLATGDSGITALNALDPTGATSSIAIQGLNGIASFLAADKAGLTSSGVECWNQGVVGVTNQVFIGNTTAPAATRQLPSVIPLVKEGVVMGSQLQIALTALLTALQAYAAALSSGGATPGYGGPNPVLAAASTALASALGAWTSAYGTPLPPRAQPFYASDTVFVSK